MLAETAVGSGSAADLWPAVFGAAGLGAESSVAQRFALFADVRGRLAQAASRSGLVLVLDDLQWADEASAVLNPGLSGARSRPSAPAAAGIGP